MKKQLVFPCIFLVLSIWFGSLTSCLIWGTNIAITSGLPNQNLNFVLLLTNILMFFGYLTFIISFFMFTFRTKWLFYIVSFLAVTYFIYSSIFYGWAANAASSGDKISIKQLEVWCDIHFFYGCVILVIVLYFIIFDIIKKMRSNKQQF